MAQPPPPPSLQSPIMMAQPPPPPLQSPITMAQPPPLRSPIDQLRHRMESASRAIQSHHNLELAATFTKITHYLGLYSDGKWKATSLDAYDPRNIVDAIDAAYRGFELALHARLRDYLEHYTDHLHDLSNLENPRYGQPVGYFTLEELDMSMQAWRELAALKVPRWLSVRLGDPDEFSNLCPTVFGHQLYQMGGGGPTTIDLVDCQRCAFRAQEYGATCQKCKFHFCAECVDGILLLQGFDKWVNRDRDGSAYMDPQQICLFMGKESLRWSRV